MFRNIVQEVKQESSSEQIPWINSSLSAEFFLVSDEIRESRNAIKEAEAERLRMEEMAKIAEKAKNEEAEKIRKLQLEIDKAKEEIEKAYQAGENSAEESARAALQAAMAEREKAEREAAQSKAESERINAEMQTALQQIEEEKQRLALLAQQSDSNQRKGSLSLSYDSEINKDTVFIAREIYEDKKEILKDYINTAEASEKDGVVLYPTEKILNQSLL